jgi:hypothetical protein
MSLPVASLRTPITGEHHLASRESCRDANQRRRHVTGHPADAPSGDMQASCDQLLQASIPAPTRTAAKRRAAVRFPGRSAATGALMAEGVVLDCTADAVTYQTLTLRA